MPVWYISRRDGKEINGFVCGLGGAGVAKRAFHTAKAAERGMSLIASRDPNGAANDEYMLEEVRGLADHLKLDEHCPALVAAVKQFPQEDTPRRVLADRLHELGVKYDRAYREARQIALNSMNPCLWPMADLKKLLRGTTSLEIRAGLEMANGRRRERIVTLASALDACRLARKYGYDVRSGGTVANSYGYRAYQTGFVVAVSSTGKLVWRARQISATRGTSVSNQLTGLPINATANQWRWWADDAD